MSETIWKVIEDLTNLPTDEALQIREEGTGYLVARVGDGESITDRDRNYAYVLAAAPQMRDALQDLIQAHNLKMGPSAIKLRIERACDAIAEAEGRTR